MIAYVEFMFPHQFFPKAKWRSTINKLANVHWPYMAHWTCLSEDNHPGKPLVTPDTTTTNNNISIPIAIGHNRNIAGQPYSGRHTYRMTSTCKDTHTSR